jgi:hypothetical protein
MSYAAGALWEINMKSRRENVPHEIVARLRLVCLDLPEAYEEPAWVGTRWMIAKKNFAHVLMIDAGWPPAYAKAAGSNGPLCVLTFRISAAAAGAQRFERPPFFRPGWWVNIVGLVLDAHTDWDEVATLITGSYCVLAPKKLAALVDEMPA